MLVMSKTPFYTWGVLSCRKTSLFICTTAIMQCMIHSADVLTKSVEVSMAFLIRVMRIS